MKKFLSTLSVLAILIAPTLRCQAGTDEPPAAAATASYLFDSGSYQESLLSSESALQSITDKEDEGRTACAELAMASAALTQKYDKCLANAAIAEQGFPKRTDAIETVKRLMDKTVSAIENDHALSPAQRDSCLEKLKNYRNAVQAEYDKQQPKRKRRNFFTKIEYYLLEGTFLAWLFWP